jgi:hypothetical protein
MWKHTKGKLAALATLVFILSHVGPAFVGAATSRAVVTLKVRIERSSILTVNNDPGRSGVHGATASVRDASAPAVLTVETTNESADSPDFDPVTGVTARASDAHGNFSPAFPARPDEAAPRPLERQGCLASYSETFNWYLVKTWNCDTGKNSVTVIYTLTSP